MADARRRTAFPPLIVRTSDGNEYRFFEPFHIGRDPECEVRISATGVSRRHLLAKVVNGQWVVSDLQSLNGTYAGDARVDAVPIDGLIELRLGHDGATIEFEPEAAAAVTATTQGSDQDSQRPGSTSDVDIRRYLDESSDSEPASDRTVMLRSVLKQMQRKQRVRHRLMLGVVAVLVTVTAIALVSAYRSARELSEQKAKAEVFFYSMRENEIRFAASLAGEKKPSADEMRRYVEERAKREQQYDEFVASQYRRTLTPEERLILRVTRILGECDIDAPDDYLNEVKYYIRQWQSTKRFANAVQLANQNGYTRVIASELLKQNLPPQFFYLAMQESNFDEFISGPPTNYGFAKGMWQFIPETGERYGLKRGPRWQVPQRDPLDDRHNWQKATVAAAQYIRDIYRTDAQASGLLVMASYNTGENRVVNLLRKMPENPRERNFWQLLAKHKAQIPSETYKYVFSIVSAAVIGENPRLFNFDFDSPLAFQAR